MLRTKKDSLPKTSEECKRRLKILENKVKNARTNPFMQSEEEFRPHFEILCKDRCKRSLSWFEEKHMNSPNAFEKRLANMARKYRERL